AIFPEIEAEAGSNNVTQPLRQSLMPGYQNSSSGSGLQSIENTIKERDHNQEEDCSFNPYEVALARQLQPNACHYCHYEEKSGNLLDNFQSTQKKCLILAILRCRSMKAKKRIK